MKSESRSSSVMRIVLDLRRLRSLERWLRPLCRWRGGSDRGVISASSSLGGRDPNGDAMNGFSVTSPNELIQREVRVWRRVSTSGLNALKGADTWHLVLTTTPTFRRAKGFRRTRRPPPPLPHANE